MSWMPDTQSEEPVFMQIVHYLEELIINNKLLPGALLPTERELAQRFAVNRSTVTAAYDQLKSSGFICSVQGSGTRVSDSLWGVQPTRSPNWQYFNNEGYFFPALPLLERIREAARLPDMVDLSLGVLSEDLLPTERYQAILDTLQLKGMLNHTGPRGLLSLRDAITDHLEAHYAIRTTPEHILVTAGAEHAMYLITHRLLNPGDAIAIEQPSYIYSRALFRTAGLRLYPIPMDHDGLIPEELHKQCLKHRIRMVIMNPTHHNPTGTSLSLLRRKQALSICDKLRIPIVEDDPYGALRHPHANQAPLPLMSLSSDNPNTIYIGTLTKSAAPGFQTGWIAAPRVVIHKLADAKAKMGFQTHAVGEQIAAQYLSSGSWAQHVAFLNAALESRCQMMIHALNRYCGEFITFTQPDGGYYIWCRMKFVIPDKEFLEHGIKRGILIMPSSIFGAEKGSFRLTFASQNEDRIEEGIKRLGAMLAEISTRVSTC
ncbi:DNA-binding transcriptional regulator, MocR family, contains an aminotransferase domain [Paenibacillus sp. 1_12]|uniref:aminotransferase-like domain-containing protein n=1 Tax=Paenibacillus sp. 1_12 TaxID=1566278 RepID=UPI0008E8A229|nr:PLP-dependent aminotransferase family protein [Paenibacillus sp. 1_12]SFL76317.1 DNA-binding transcriptional regulator, MocR family, contains an aminotransferase domain [Paenibacillus sp. 1_12]